MVVFAILKPNLRLVSGIEKLFFLKILLTRIVFWCEIHRELPCRWNHFIIISVSRSKVEKTMKNSVFSTFDCDPEITLLLLFIIIVIIIISYYYCYYCNITVISSELHPKKDFF